MENVKRVLFMGDSITELYMGHNGWPRYFCEILGVEKHACAAVSGARWCDYENTVRDSHPEIVVNEDNRNNTMCNQVERVRREKATNGLFSDFDIIIIAAGTNDEEPESDECADAQFVRDGEYIPLGQVDTRTFGGSVRYVCENLFELYPNAAIFLCGPVQADEALRPFDSILRKGELLQRLSARLSVNFIDTIHCGIYGRYEKRGTCGRSLCDGLHPNDNGARQLARFIAGAVVGYRI